MDLCRVETVLARAAERLDDADAIDPAMLGLLHRQHLILTELDQRERLLRLAMRWAQVPRPRQGDETPGSNVVALFPDAEVGS